MTSRELFLSALRAQPAQSAERIIGDGLAGTNRDQTLEFVTRVMANTPQGSRPWIVANAVWRVIWGRA